MNRKLLWIAVIVVFAGCSNEADEGVPADTSVESFTNDNAAEGERNRPSVEAESDPAQQTVGVPGSQNNLQSSPNAIRFATFNVAMNRKAAGELAKSLGDGDLPAGKRVAEIVQRVRPQVLLLNEVDFDEDRAAIKVLLEKYFAVPQGEQKSIEYPHVYTSVVNTGVPSGMDLDQDGASDGPGDSFGYGAFPGQYGMVVLSQFPIDAASVRAMRQFLWKDMPDAQLPADPESKKPFYSAEVLRKLRLSSKSHWDVPVYINGATVHFLVCHPTPPVFDGPEDRNGKRNHDEVRLWSDYVDPSRSEYIYDDDGKTGGLAAGDHFVIAGDLNADPFDGDSAAGTMQRLLEHPLLHADPTPIGSGGGPAKATKDGMANAGHKGDPNTDTGDFPDKYSGNLRVDYVLPSKTLKVIGSGVFWPAPDAEGADLVRASDHRLVWVDVELP